MARFLLDEDMPRSAAEVLRRAGHVAEHVVEAGFRSRPDPDVFRYAQENRAVLITADLDFADVREYPLGSHAGIIVVRMSKRLSIVERNEELVRAIAQLRDENLDGLLIIVQMHRTRIRRPRAT
jgi:predicted nuclease of predicted toxin-antitoxin system